MTLDEMFKAATDRNRIKSGRTLEPTLNDFLDVLACFGTNEQWARIIKGYAPSAWRRLYQAYLMSSAWASKRQAAMACAKGMCQACGVAQADHVHHLTYKRLGDEKPEDLKALCRECHSKVHGRS